MSAEELKQEEKNVNPNDQKDKVSTSQFFVERGLLTEFNASVLQPSNTSGSVAPPPAADRRSDGDCGFNWPDSHAHRRFG